jgi:class 3 adenylate cyclase
VKSENLAIMFVDIKGFTSRTSLQSRMENHRMLARFEDLVRPVSRAFGGSIVKSIGDAFLITFRSPTDALQCGMGIQDLQHDWNGKVPPAERFEVRVAVNVGEVRVEKGDIFGDAVNIASRIESVSEAGEVYFSEAVYLVMNKSEVPYEELGRRKLKGIQDSIKIYRIPRVEEVGDYRLKGSGRSNARPIKGGKLDPKPLPFGGQTLGRINSPLAPSAELEWGGRALWAALSIPHQEARAGMERRWKDPGFSRWLAPFVYFTILLFREIVALFKWTTWVNFFVMLYDLLLYVVSQFPPPAAKTSGLGALLENLLFLHEEASDETKLMKEKKAFSSQAIPFVYFGRLCRKVGFWIIEKQTWAYVGQALLGIPGYLWRFVRYSPGFAFFLALFITALIYFGNHRDRSFQWPSFPAKKKAAVEGRLLPAPVEKGRI